MIEAEELKILSKVMSEKQIVYDAYSHRLKEFSNRHISKVVTEYEYNFLHLVSNLKDPRQPET